MLCFKTVRHKAGWEDGQECQSCECRCTQLVTSTEAETVTEKETQKHIKTPEVILTDTPGHRALEFAFAEFCKGAELDNVTCNLFQLGMCIIHF